MGTEALAEVARARSGVSGGAVENEQILGAFKFHRKKPQTLYLSATARLRPTGLDRRRRAALVTSRPRKTCRPGQGALPRGGATAAGAAELPR